MERTESSREMRGAREVFYEYILELHGRTGNLVGHDGGMHVTAGEYCFVNRHADFGTVLSEAGSVSCL